MICHYLGRLIDRLQMGGDCGTVLVLTGGICMYGCWLVVVPWASTIVFVIYSYSAIFSPGNSVGYSIPLFLSFLFFSLSNSEPGTAAEQCDNMMVQFVFSQRTTQVGTTLPTIATSMPDSRPRLRLHPNISIKPNLQSLQSSLSMPLSTL